MWEALESPPKSGSLPLPIVLLGVPRKVPVADIIMPKGETRNQKNEGKGGMGRDKQDKDVRLVRPGMRRKARRIPGKRRKKKGQSIVDPDRGVPMSTGVNSSE
jgi:hypothetical protein